MKSHYRITWIVLALTALILISPTNSWAGTTPDFVVAPDGNDANPGTAEAPFATVAKTFPAGPPRVATRGPNTMMFSNRFSEAGRSTFIPYSSDRRMNSFVLSVSRFTGL